MSLMVQRRRKKNSFIWNYFTEVGNGIATCNDCERKVSFKSSISNLSKHLARKHPDKKLCKTPVNMVIKQEVQEECDTAKDDTPGVFPKSKRKKNSIMWNHFTELGFGMAKCNLCKQKLSFKSSVTNLRKHMVRKHLNKNKSLPDNAEFQNYLEGEVNDNQEEMLLMPEELIFNKMDRCLLDMLILDLQPFGLLNNKGFKSFVNVLNPEYEIPNKDTLSKIMLPMLYEKTLIKIKDLLQSAKKICVATEYWTSIKNNNYMSVTVHFICNEFKMTSIFLECLQIENKEEDLKRIITEFNLDNKILTIVSNNFDNVHNYEHIDCFTHTLNLIVSDGLNAIKSTLLEIGKITTVQIDEPMQFNSILYMLQAYIKLEPCKLFKIANELCKILKPFESIMKSISNENYAPASLVIVLVSGLNSVCKSMLSQDFSLICKEVISDIQIGIKDRLGDVENNKTLGMCTFLDPRFKNIAFTNQNCSKNIEDLLIDLMRDKLENEQEVAIDNEDTHETDELSVWSHFDKSISKIQPRNTVLSKAQIEMERYLECKVLNRNEDPMDWWSSHRSMFPHLSTIMQEIFCTSATSVPCDAFTKDGDVLKEKRSHLSAKYVKEMVFLNANFQFNT